MMTKSVEQRKQEILERIRRGNAVISESKARCEALRIYTERVLAKTEQYKSLNSRDRIKPLNREEARVDV